MNFRPYDPQKDLPAMERIWREVGWLDTEADKKGMTLFMSITRALVAEINGAAETVATSMPGAMRYLAEDVPMAAVTAVINGRIARKQGISSRLTAQLVAEDAAAGALVSTLSMFEQGFYDKLGFGTGVYEHTVNFDPAQLRLPVRPRIPRRITKEDWVQAHSALLNRQRGHGGVNIFPPEVFEVEMGWTPGGFGLGYADNPDGTLSHFFWGSSKGEHGPYRISFMAYQNWEQFLELMGLIRNLGDQVRAVRMREPRDIQLQDLLVQPFRFEQISRNSPYKNAIEAYAFWQLRVNDLPGCLAKTHLPASEPVRFNAVITDPIAEFLPDDAPWRGIGGEYVVTLGANSAAERGNDPALPTLSASAGAFARLWLGVRPASGLAVTDDLSAPPALISALDDVLCLPSPHFEWEF